MITGRKWHDYLATNNVSLSICEFVRKKILFFRTFFFLLAG